MITIIIGTNREKSKTGIIGKQLETIYHQLKKNQKISLIDLSLLPQEVFSPNAYQEKPKLLMPFIEKVLDAKGFHFVIPEYNGSFPGALKYFIDMLPFPDAFERKKVAFLGLASGIWGGLRAVEHIEQVFGYRNSYKYPKRVFIPNIDKIFNEKTGINDKKIISRMTEQSEGFLNFVQSFS